MTIPLARSGIILRAEPRSAACAFYIVKKQETVFRTGFGPRKKFLSSEICAQALSSKVREWAKIRRARAGPAGQAQFAQV
jgi:hypothetical protein